MAKPNVTPSVNDDKDYVDLPGVSPITPSSFAAGSPVNPIQLPDQVIGPPEKSPAPTSPLPSATPALPSAPIAGLPTIPSGAPGFASSPLGPQAGVAADASVFTDMANTHRELGKALAEGKLDEAAKHEQFAQQQEQSLGESRAQWAAAQADQMAREKKMDAAIAQGKALGIDPNRYWNRQGTGANILSAISVGLGSFGSGMTHGATGNPALTLVNNAIDHDIASQKDNIDNYWKTLVQQGHVDDNAMQRALTTQTLQGNMRLAGFKVYESDLKAIQAKTDSEVVKLGAQKQIDDVQLQMNAERKQLAAWKAAQQTAGAQAATAQANKDSESFRKDVLDYGKEHPNLSPSEAAKEVAQIDPARTARLGSRSALPADLQAEHVAKKEEGFAVAFNNAAKVVADKNIDDYEAKIGTRASDADKAVIREQTIGLLLKQHPEFAKFQYYKPARKDGEVGLYDVRPPVEPTTGATGDRRSQKQIDEESKLMVQVPDEKGNLVQRVAANADSQKRIEEFRDAGLTAKTLIQTIRDPNATPQSKFEAFDNLKALAPKLLTGSQRPAGDKGPTGFLGIGYKGLEGLNIEDLVKDPKTLDGVAREINDKWANVSGNGIRGGYKGAGLIPTAEAPKGTTAGGGLVVPPQTFNDSQGNQFIVKKLNGVDWVFNPQTNEPISPYKPSMAPKNYDFQPR